jgi:hypothetical protein
MQRHRNDDVGVGQELGARARHPSAHHRGEIGAVLIFERVNHRARHVVIAHGGAGAAVGRRIGDRFHRQQAGPRVVDEGDAQPLAIRPLDERHL